MTIAAIRRTLPALITVCFVGTAFGADEKPKTDGQDLREVKVEDIVLKIPADWKQQPPANKLRLTQFAVPTAEGDEQPTEVSVSIAGGGADANLTRWRGQFSDGHKASVKKGTSKQGTYYLFDGHGTFQMSIGPPIQGKTVTIPNARMLGIILETENKGTYFLKLVGPEKTVSAQEDALRASIGGDKKSEKPYEVK